MKNSVQVTDNKGITYYSLRYYTVAGRYLIRNYDVAVIAELPEY